MEKSPLRIRIDFDDTLFATDEHGQNYPYPIDVYAKSVVQIFNRKHEVKILTARHPSWNWEIRALLKANDFPDLEIINSETKTDEEWDVLIDDNPDQYMYWLQEGSVSHNQRYFIVFNQMWNDYLEAEYMAFSWKDIFMQVKEIHGKMERSGDE